MRELIWILRLARPLWRQFTLAALLGLATVASGLGLLATAAHLIASAALQPSIAELQVAIVGVRFLGLSRGVLRYLERYLSHDVTFKLLKRTRVWFYRQLEPLAPAALGFRGSGELLARLIDDIETLQYFFLRTLQPPFIAAIGALILAAILIPIDGIMAAIWLMLLAFAGVALPLMVNHFGQPIHSRLLRQRGQLKQTLIELVQGMSDLLAYDAGNWHLRRFTRIDQALIIDQKRLHSLDSLVQAGLAGATQLAPIAVLWLMTPAVAIGELSGIGLAVLVVAALASFELVTPLISALPALEASLASIRRLLEISQQKPAIREPDQPAAVADIKEYGLEVKDLAFTYGEGELPALGGIDLSIAAGQHVALVGPSGSGKTTLLNLLLRFWQYETGSIQLGDKELRMLPSEQARSLFSVLSQQTMLFSGSLRQNLLLAKPTANSEELVHALRLAGAEDLLALLPEGLDTEIGEWGWRLSVGQQRRVALARTLLQDRPYLLLDEPTANLDPALANRILTDILIACESKTILMITHQLAGLESFDWIAVLDHGQIRQRGQHQDLVEQPGLYRKMWRLQIERWQMESKLAGLHY